MMKKRKPIFWEKAKKELSRKDPILKKIFSNYKKGALYPSNDSFRTLCKSIVGQQISVKAADSIWKRLIKTTGKISAKKIARIDQRKLKKIGLSRQKIKYLKNLSKKILSREIVLAKFKKMSDEKIKEELTTLNGIGNWTAEMFLIFNLGRPNVMPVNDIGLIKAICLHYKKKFPLQEKEILKISNKWKPWQTVAVWYLWRSLDPQPVSY